MGVSQAIWCVCVFSQEAHDGRGLGESDTASRGVCRAGERKVGGSRTDSNPLGQILLAVHAGKVVRQVPRFTLFHLQVQMPIVPLWVPFCLPLGLYLSGLRLRHIPSTVSSDDGPLMKTKRILTSPHLHVARREAPRNDLRAHLSA